MAGDLIHDLWQWNLAPLQKTSRAPRASDYSGVREAALACDGAIHA
jgi:hypothetical protein